MSVGLLLFCCFVVVWSRGMREAEARMFCDQILKFLNVWRVCQEVLRVLLARLAIAVVWAIRWLAGAAGGPCLSQHGSVQLSPHSWPQQCPEPETRGGSVSRPRLSGSLEGLHCVWCTESRLLFLRHALEPGQRHHALAPLCPLGSRGGCCMRNFCGPPSKNCP